MAKLDPYSYEPPIRPTGNFVGDMNAMYDELEKEKARAAETFEETGKVPVGAIYQQQYADGYAVYRVSKLRPFTVQHVAVGDAWTLPAPTIRGLIAQDFADEMRRRKAMADLFG